MGAVALPTVLLLLGGSWTADTLKGWADHAGSAWQTAVAVATLLLGLAWLYRVRHRFLPANHLIQRDSTPHRGLILLVSDMGRFELQGEAGGCRLRARGTSAFWQLPGTSIAADIFALEGSRWGWQHTLRSLEKHLPASNAWYSSAPHCHPRLPEFTRLLRHYKPGLRVQTAAAADFDGLDAVHGAIRQAVRALQGQGLRRRDILIDVTGGTKIASIAAALATLHEPGWNSSTYVRKSPTTC